MNINLSTYQNRVNQCITQYLKTKSSYQNSDLKDAILYAILPGGKRFRPLLVYLIAELFDTELVYADSAACAIEFIHSYSLVHDDLPAMDNDNMRHNKPCCHVVYGEAMAILVGDALQTLAFDIIANDQYINDSQKVNIIGSLAQHSGMSGMVLGQDLDMHLSHNDMDQSKLLKNYQYKTVSLLQCACQLGVFCSKQSTTLLDGVNRFASCIGLAYQIQDDVLDLTNSNISGKNQFSDIKNNKITYATMFGVEKSQVMFNRYYDKAISLIEQFDNNSLLKAFVLMLKNRCY